MYSLPLADKVVVIVGATSGFGLSAAKACVAAGANVLGVGPDEASVESAREQLADAAWFVGDAISPNMAESAIAAAVTRFGKLDGLYHVAGGSGRRFGDGPLHEVSDEGWQQTVELNQTSVFYSNRAALKTFMNQGNGGSILNMSTALAIAPSPKYFAAHAYATAKAGVIGMTRSLAAYYAPHNIRVNAIAPGCSDTPMAARARDNEEIHAFLRLKQPLDGGRMGNAEDLDGAVVYLLSDAARFVTGQVLAVDGGWSVSDGVER